MIIWQYIIDFFDLFFPKSCITCATNLVQQENIFCTECLYDIPKTNFHKIKDNPVSILFAGLVKIEYASAYFFYRKGSKYQQAIHKLKYKGIRDSGVELGKKYGSELVGSPFSEIDIIIPVPLHPKRFKTRGYNQSEAIAEGLAETMQLPYDFTSIIRVVNTETQTKKSLSERRENVSSIFEIKDYKHLHNKHILLVDDVITTGSTLTALAETLLAVSGVKISILALAVALGD